MKEAILTAWVALFSILITNCGQYRPPGKTEKVEISPGVFLSVEKWDWTVDDRANPGRKESTEIHLTYRGVPIEWHDVAIPVILREWENRLYLIGFDRETGRQTHTPTPARLRYFRQEDSKFVEISPAGFPKRIATQNMWLSGRDPRERAAELEIKTDDAFFLHGLTAQIWRQLETGQPYSIGTVEQSLVDDFKQKYQPIQLTGK